MLTNNDNIKHTNIVFAGGKRNRLKLLKMAVKLQSRGVTSRQSVGVELERTRPLPTVCEMRGMDPPS